MKDKSMVCPECSDPVTDPQDVELFEAKGFYRCPECEREGCNACMPSGRGCMCPECEEAAADDEDNG